MAAEANALTSVDQQRPRKPLGQIFVEKGLLTEVSVQRLIAHAKSKNIRLGELLEVIGLVTPDELAKSLAIQYRCGNIHDFARYSYAPAVLRTIPIEMAVAHSIFPLKADADRVALAVADPTMDQLFQKIAAKNDLKPILYVATRTEISRAVARHYLGQAILEPKPKTILLIEDDTLVRDMVARILTRKGYFVETAVDGMDAFGKIFNMKPMLVIVDKVMPKLGGYDFLFAIRNIPELRYMPVILITAAATPDEEKQALENGFFDLVLKPVKEVGLLTRVQRAFESSEKLYGKAG